MAEDEGKAAIRLQPNGPLQAAGLEKFTNSRGESVTAKKVMYLCRCGGSKNKPFCDGSHARNGFDDAPSGLGC